VTPSLFIISLLIAPTVMHLARSYPPSTLTRLMPRIINFILAFLSIECVTRFIFSSYMPATAETDFSDSFYLYKFSLFFVDSNFVGIEILCLLAVMFAFRETIDKKRWLLAYFLLLASLSRASIAAAICQLIVYKLWRWRVWAVLGMLIAQVLIMIELFLSFTSSDSSSIKDLDGSFASKFFLLSLMVDTYGEADKVQKLLGVGAGNFFNLFGILSAHNIVVICVTEIGIAGTLLLVVYVWLLSRKCPVAISLLILPIVINGFALLSAWAMPFFFAALGLLGALRGTWRDGSEISGSKTTTRGNLKG
jgi:hypothetical protein